ncbi:hypothetical protein PINS_up011293 [Pythium insidiosum]|nr:hypothetical protein PINS_up011293 [Pythium insidiosum]
MLGSSESRVPDHSPVNAVPGDVIILTKPLGTQVAVNFFQWRKKPERWQRVENIATVEDAEEAFLMATESMTRLNLNAARLMHKVCVAAPDLQRCAQCLMLASRVNGSSTAAHSATDVTGFGILRHARNQAKSQNQAVDFEIHTLPIIRNMVKVNETIGNSFKLLDGLAARDLGRSAAVLAGGARAGLHSRAQGARWKARVGRRTRRSWQPRRPHRERLQGHRGLAGRLSGRSSPVIPSGGRLHTCRPERSEFFVVWCVSGSPDSFRQIYGSISIYVRAMIIDKLGRRVRRASRLERQSSSARAGVGGMDKQIEGIAVWFLRHCSFASDDGGQYFTGSSGGCFVPGPMRHMHCQRMVGTAKAKKSALQMMARLACWDA